MTFWVIAEATAFWGLLLLLMYFWARECVRSTEQYEVLAVRDGVGLTSFTLWMNGFLAFGLSVVEAGLWLNRSTDYAWIIMVGHIIVTVVPMYVSTEPPEDL